MQKRKISRNNKGITLIALIITIIIMLILVGVSVTVALNGGLFRTAEKAADGTEDGRDKELERAEGQVEVGGLTYNSAQDYIDKKTKLPNNATILDEESVKQNTTTTNWDLSKVTAVQIKKADGTVEGIIPLPKEYQISLEDGENTIAGGLVITDGENEFVWIPVKNDFKTRYSISVYSEPRSSYATQKDLDKYYGTKEDEQTSYYTLEDDFNFSVHYTEMLRSVNKYNGFYIGRYETTIDQGNIGSKENTTVLTSRDILKIGENSNNNNEPYYYRWWGLYVAQRNSNVKGNGDYIQTSMIWGQQWNALDSFLGNNDYTISNLVTPKELQKSGQSKYMYENKTITDKACNIYDLRGNTREWAAMASNDKPFFYGGCYAEPGKGVYAAFGAYKYDGASNQMGSRIALQIK